MGWQGRYYDGQSAARHEVTIEMEPDRLDLGPVGGSTLHWAFGDLYWVESPGSGAVHLGLATSPGARLVIEDPGFAGSLRHVFPQIDRATSRHLGHRRSLYVILGCSLALVAVIYSAIAFLPGWIAPLAPESIQRTVGDAVIRDVISIFGKLDKKSGDGRLCTNEDGQAALNRLVARLAGQAGTAGNEPGAFQVQVTNIKITNALAAPGGRILLFLGLIEFARSPDELAGVLAHEMGHALHRHPTVSIIREIGMVATLDLLLGRGVAGGTAGILLRTSYSRDAEREADDTGFRLMRQAGMSTAGMVELFERFEKELPSPPKALQAFSSHPRSTDRAKRLAGQAKDSGGPAMPAADWQALRKICDQG